MQFNEERLAEFASQNTKAMSDISEAEERRGFASNELASVKERLAASEATLATHREALKTRQAALQQI